MIKNLLLITVFLFALSSCSHKNEFGLRRNNSSVRRIEPNTDDRAYSVIDTAALYQLLSTRDKINNQIDAEIAKGIQQNPRYLKFYAHGRVGEFTHIDFNTIATFNPKKAASYLYQYKNNELIVQIYFRHPECGECFIKQKVDKVSEETIELSNDQYIDTYKKVPIPKNYLIFKPDW